MGHKAWITHSHCYFHHILLAEQEIRQPSFSTGELDPTSPWKKLQSHMAKGVGLRNTALFHTHGFSPLLFLFPRC
uniref:Uncharacterized protein n=1 Tax=Sus scrofa TaxID=9823 RepID=A0A8D0X6L4_PIG